MFNLLFIVLSFAIGSEWTQEKLNVGGLVGNVQAALILSPQEMFLRTYNGGYRAFYSNDGGKTLRQDNYFANYVPMGANIGGSLVVTYAGTVHQWDDGKLTQLLNIPVNFHGSAMGYAIGDSNGTLLMNRNANEIDRWELITTGSRTYSITISQTGKVLLSTEKGTMIMDAEDKKLTLLNNALVGLFVFASGEHFLGLHGRDIYRLKGKTWEKTEITNILLQNQVHYERAGVFRLAQQHKYVWIKVDDDGKTVAEEIPTIAQSSIVGANTSGGQPTIIFNNGIMLHQKKLAKLRINFIGEGTVRIKTQKGAQGTNLRLRKSDELDQEFYVGQSIELEGIEKTGFKFAGWQINGKKELNANSKIRMVLPKEVYEITAQFEKN